MTDRINEGFKIYQRSHVKFIAETKGFYEFEVRGSLDKKTGLRNKYYVTYEDGVWNCLCWDFQRNHKQDHGGSWTCKHINAAMFKLGEIKGINQQVNVFGKPLAGPGPAAQGMVNFKGPNPGEIKLDLTPKPPTTPAPGEIIRQITEKAGLKKEGSR